MSLYKAIQFCCEHRGSLEISNPAMTHEATVKMVIMIQHHGKEIFNEGFAAIGYAYEPDVVLDCLADRLVSSIKEKMCELNGINEKGAG